MYKINPNVINLSVILFLLRIINAQNNEQDYMRRQHSLVKPYQGKVVLIGIGSRIKTN